MAPRANPVCVAISSYDSPESHKSSTSRSRGVSCSSAARTCECSPSVCSASSDGGALAGGSLFRSVRWRRSRAARRASSRAMFAATTNSQPRAFAGLWTSARANASWARSSARAASHTLRYRNRTRARYVLRYTSARSSGIEFNAERGTGNAEQRNPAPRTPPYCSAFRVPTSALVSSPKVLDQLRQLARRPVGLAPRLNLDAHPPAGHQDGGLQARGLHQLGEGAQQSEVCVAECRDLDHPQRIAVRDVCPSAVSPHEDSTSNPLRTRGFGEPGVRREGLFAAVSPSGHRHGPLPSPFSPIAPEHHQLIPCE